MLRRSLKPEQLAALGLTESEYLLALALKELLYSKRKLAQVSATGISAAVAKQSFQCTNLLDHTDKEAFLFDLVRFNCVCVLENLAFTQSK